MTQYSHWFIGAILLLGTSCGAASVSPSHASGAISNFDPTNAPDDAMTESEGAKKFETAADEPSASPSPSPSTASSTTEANGPSDTSSTTSTTMLPLGGNSAPQNTLPASLTIDANSSNVKISGFSFADANNDNLSLTLTATNGTITVSTNSPGGITAATNNGTASVTLPASKAGVLNATLDSKSRGLKFTPTASFTGAATITVAVDDGNGGTDSDILNVTVAPIPTVLTPIPDKAYADGTAIGGLSIDTTGTFSHMTVGETLTYSMTSKVYGTGDPTAFASANFLSFDATTKVLTNTAPLSTGTTVVSIIATDTNGRTATERFEVFVYAAGTTIGTTGNDTVTNGKYFGDAGSDIVTGTNNADTIHLGDGEDKCLTLGGNDIIYDGSGSTLGAPTGSVLGSGDDILYGGEGDDIMNGQSGIDTFYGGPDNDSAFGGTESDVLYGEEGDDTFYGQNDNDSLYGGAGNDTLNGQTENDIIYGEAGDDALDGSTGNDTMNGGTGSDRITSSSGIDAITGGADRDLFAVTGGSGIGSGNRTVISDFTQGEDVMQLAANVAFIGTAAFDSDGSTLQARYAQSGGLTVIEVDSSGDGVGDYEVELTGTIDLTSLDFVQ